VKDVIIIIIDGAKDKIVISMTILTVKLKSCGLEDSSIPSLIDGNVF
tara:strand:+ start:46 stop:186 length:141 start_codon:yes stop_codon:yes gene_type:complete